jgi:hypothetical protein
MRDTNIRAKRMKMMSLCVMTQINYRRIHFSICECILLARARARFQIAAKMSQNAYNYGRIEPPPANPISCEQRMHAYNGSGRYNAMKIK